jgi:DNA-binding SARP family transcriptional activator
VRFAILGPVEAIADSGPIGLGGARSRALLAMLVLRANHVVPADVIAEELWPGLDPERATANLHVRMAELRRALRAVGESGRLVTRKPGYLLHAGAEEIDATRFAALVAQARVLLRDGDPAGASACLDAALQLWRGPALGNVGDAAWARGEMERLAESRLGALELRMDAALSTGAGSDLITELRELTAAHPLRERFWAQQMLALYRAGRQGDALLAFQQARSHLVTELGVEPGTELRALQERMLAQDPALDHSPALGHSPAAVHDAGAASSGPASSGPASAGAGREVPARLRVPRQLPPSLSSFTGRRGELALLDALLQDGARAAGSVSIAAITGCGGIGKTALALHWAHLASSRFPDGQLYVNLRGFDPVAPPVAASTAITGFLDGLGIPARQIPRDTAAQVALFRSLAAGKRLLIVLDNARDPAHVRQLLPASPESVVLVTSRSWLGGLVAGDGARPVSLDVIADDEAAALLEARAGSQRLAADPLAVSQLTGLCAGLPLALAITASQVVARPQVPLRELAAALASSQQRRLDAFETGDDATSLRAVLSWSYQRLSPAAARCFRLVGAHPGPHIAAAAAASLGGASMHETRRVLAELTGASLLSEQAPGRYACHDLLRAYAAELLDELDSPLERAAATRRVLDHYLQTAAQAAALVNGQELAFAAEPAAASVTVARLAGRPAALAWFEAEHQTLLAAAAQATAAGLDRHGWQIPHAIRLYLSMAGHWQDRDAADALALAAAERLGDPLALGKCHFATANLRHVQGREEAAITHVREAIRHLESAGDLRGQSDAQLVLAFALKALGRFDAALSHTERSLALAADCGYEFNEGAALAAIGDIQVMLGRPRDAVGYCEQAVAVFRRLGATRGLVAALDSLGCAQVLAGDVAAGISSLRQAIAECEDGNRSALARIHCSLGDAHEAAGDEQAARQAWQQALDLLGDAPHPQADRVRARLRRAAEPAAAALPDQLAVVS